MDPKSYFEQEHLQSNKKSESLRKKIILNSILRLTFFLGIFLLFFLIVNHSIPLAIAGAVLSLFCFLFLVVRHIKLQQKKNYWDAYKMITESELKACEHNFEDFPEGKGFVNHRHEFTYDLDIFGEGSIFQMLNRTITKMGESRLADYFQHPVLEKQEIEKTQSAVKELSTMPDFLLDFRATGKTSEIESEDNKLIIKWAAASSFMRGKRYLRFLSFLMPALIISISIASIFISSLSSLIILLFILNLSIIGMNARKINREHSHVSQFLKILQKYQGLLSKINQVNGKSELLTGISEQLTLEGQNADALLKQLTRQVEAFDTRLNFLVAIFLEGFLLWDLHCIYRIEKWRINCGARLPIWLDEVSHFDALVSLGAFSFLHTDFSYPEISNTTILKTEMLGHPLIPPQKRIDNDFGIDKQGEFIIITGANMAGKSTFLRTVGVNLILAAIGVPVCAKKFQFKPMKLFTSMRTSDSLRENESYFYAELRRLKEMLDLLQKGEPLFIILDEILKGTNSIDKQKGSQSALEKIVRLKGTGIIATHDLALAGLADSYAGQIKNQCFEIEIDNAQIYFDYKLYPGVTQKMNALLLMEQMGII